VARCVPSSLRVKENKNSFRSSKLSPTLLGPYTVTKQEGNNFSCYHNQLNTQHTFHSDRVTPFTGSTTIAHDIGMLDEEEYIVEKILSHRGVWTRLKSLEFLVRWHGYDTACDSWEPWTALRRVQALHTYLESFTRIYCGMVSSLIRHK
jgi:Chromo (CHRromatin Organisation MOdifier) domain